MSRCRTSRSRLVRGARALPRLVRATVRVCLRHRVTGLASEAAFFALMSLPPLVLGLVASLGLVGSRLGGGVTGEVVAAIRAYAARFLTADSIAQVIDPTVDAVVRHGRVDLVSVGFVLSLWSGSRALNVFVDTISIMYGQSGIRGIVRGRTLSFSLYTAAVVIGSVLLPLVLAGPTLLGRWLAPHAPGLLEPLRLLYWPVVVAAVVATVTSLFHIATPRRSPWVRDLPGAVLTLALWVGASFVIRTWVGHAIGGSSVYGPLSTPIVLMVWFYFLAISVLVGAAFNAAVRATWPTPEAASVPARVASSVRERLAGSERPVLVLLPGRADPAPSGARSVFGPVAAGLVATRDGAGAGALRPAANGLDAPVRHRLVSVTTQGG